MPPDQTPDITSGGFPCQPFSTQRSRAGSTAKTGLTEGHPAYETLVVEFKNYLRARAPKCWWIEEVLGFNKRIEALKMSPLAYVCAAARELGYSVEALELDHSVCINVKRPRIFLLAVHACAGGQRGLDFSSAMVARVAEAVTNRNARPTIFDICPPFSPEEKRRRKQGKDCDAVCMYMDICIYIYIFAAASFCWPPFLDS